MTKKFTVRLKIEDCGEEKRIVATTHESGNPNAVVDQGNVHLDAEAEATLKFQAIGGDEFRVSFENCSSSNNGPCSPCAQAPDATDLIVAPNASCTFANDDVIKYSVQAMQGGNPLPEVAVLDPMIVIRQNREGPSPGVDFQLNLPVVGLIVLSLVIGFVAGRIAARRRS